MYTQSYKKEKKMKKQHGVFLNLTNQQTSCGTIDTVSQLTFDKQTHLLLKG